MIYLIYGDDSIKSRAKYQNLLQSLSAKNREAGFFKLTSENFSSDNLRELIKSRGLFYQKLIVGGDNLFSISEKKDDIEQIDNYLSAMTQSDNIFILLENNLNQTVLGKIKKLATKSQEFYLSSSSLPIKSSLGSATFNIFAITDALALRDKNRLWVLYQEALMSGLSAEEIFWKIIWQTNNLLLVKNTKDYGQLKMKPFFLTKNKTASKNFSNQDLKDLSKKLINLYHDNFLGTDEFEFGLEKILLSI